MTSNACAAVLHEPDGKFLLEDVVLDDIRADEVLVKIEATGVCHTDIKARALIDTPCVLGHEGVGVIAELGEEVESLNVGQRVVISYPWCGTCSICLDERPYLCEHLLPLCFGGHRLDGSRTIKFKDKPIASAFFQQSSFASHAITLARDVVAVDEDMAPHLLAALPCGIQTGAGAICNTFAMQAGQSLLVIGVGAVGLSAIMMAKLTGIDPIIAVDIIDSRLELAADLGASHCLNVKTENIPTAVLNIKRDGVDYAFETSGTEQGLLDAIECLVREGICGIVAAPHDGKHFRFNPRTLILRGASLRGVIQGSAIPATFISILIKLQQQGSFPFERLICTYAFEDINQAIEDSLSGRTVKPVLLM